MKIFINDEEITVFHGAKVLDVLRAYYALHDKKVPGILPTAIDAYGNSVAPDGELADGNHLYIRE